MEWIVGLFVFLVGITIGSFLNVCIYRVPQGISIAKGFSACPQCSVRLTVADLVPLLSYAVLRGKCRHCGCKISPVYPLVEGATGALYVLLFVRFGLSPDLLIYAALVSLLIVVTMIDIKHMMIPNGLIIAGLILGVGKLTASVFTGIFGSWTLYAIGFAAGALPLLLIALFCAYVLKKEAIGGGDIKLMAFAGLVIGWKLVIPAYLIGVTAGALIGIALMASGKKKRGDEIPFGPSLCFGVLVSVFFGNQLIAWYLGLM
jgi:Type II secretory pathway, prepilin signal peptidase PulO and related peptidases